MTRRVRSLLHAAYVLFLPLLLFGVLAAGFISLTKLEEAGGQRILTVYDSPIDLMLAGAIFGPVLLLFYLVYWVICHLSGSNRRIRRWH